MSEVKHSSAAPVDELVALLKAAAIESRKAASGIGVQQSLLYLADEMGLLEGLMREQAVAIRLHLALSLAPRAAVNHSISDRLSRVSKIRAHLLSNYGLEGATLDVVSRVVNEALAAWATKRVDVSSYLLTLAERDGWVCKVCRADLKVPGHNPSVLQRDVFKPSALVHEQFFSPEVDHIDPVSRFGSNALENLEILCWNCNRAKEDLSLPLPKHEFLYGPILPMGTIEEYEDMPQVVRTYLRKVAFFVMQRGGRRCARDGCSGTAELTVRLLDEEGLLIMSNCEPVCYECLGSV